MASRLGWFSAAIVRASCFSRCSSPGSADPAALRTLIATSRPSLGSRARNTSPMPPAPSSATISYSPSRLPGASGMRAILPRRPAPACMLAGMIQWAPRIGAACLLASALAGAQAIRFTVTPEPAAHRFAVEMRVAHPQAGIADFEMPEWMPGYYRLLHYAQYVSAFDARDGQGRALGWQQVTPDTWRVVTGSAAALTLRYQVAASRPFAADNSIADDRAFIAPPGMYLYPKGQLDQPVQVAIALPPQWNSVATGLDPARGQAHAFTALNYDVLFDSPMLLGNQEHLHFTVQGVPHDIALQDAPASVDRAKMTSDLKRIVVAATTLMGTVPYDRYTFLLMGRGNGGIEHWNSMAAEFNGNQMATPEQYQRWLSYIAHEYFHNFNVKRIRPLA